MQATIYRRDALLAAVRCTTSPVVTLTEFVELFVETVLGRGRLVIREDLPHIDVMRAGIRIGLTFTFEDFDEGPRMVAHRAAAA